MSERNCDGCKHKFEPAPYVPRFRKGDWVTNGSDVYPAAYDDDAECPRYVIPWRPGPGAVVEWTVNGVDYASVISTVDGDRATTTHERNGGKWRKHNCGGSLDLTPAEMRQWNLRPASPEVVQSFRDWQAAQAKPAPVALDDLVELTA